jgi:hypothetical protein
MPAAIKGLILMTLLAGSLAAASCSGADSAPPPAPPPAQPSAGPTVEPGDLVPLSLQFPDAKEIRTPRPTPWDERVESLLTDRTVAMAPKGSVNLALGKPVTSSGGPPIVGNLSRITNGDKETDEGKWLEIDEGKQWVQIDLGQSNRLYAVAVWHVHGIPSAVKDVVVQLSDDPEFVTGVTTIFNNDYDNSSGLGVGADPEYIETCYGRTMDAKGVQARYVRLYSNGDDATEANRYMQVEAWGLPPK